MSDEGSMASVQCDIRGCVSPSAHRYKLVDGHRTDTVDLCKFHNGAVIIASRSTGDEP